MATGSVELRRGTTYTNSMIGCTSCRCFSSTARKAQPCGWTGQGNFSSGNVSQLMVVPGKPETPGQHVRLGPFEQPRHVAGLLVDKSGQGCWSLQALAQKDSAESEPTPFPCCHSQGVVVAL
jgi:hypothetical protein